MTLQLFSPKFFDSCFSRIFESNDQIRTKNDCKVMANTCFADFILLEMLY